MENIGPVFFFFSLNRKIKALLRMTLIYELIIAYNWKTVFFYFKYESNMMHIAKYDSFHDILSERSDECIDFTMFFFSVCVYTKTCRNNTSISNFGDGFR
ncbi:Uncharacterized protein FWK35_00001778 [Aphis craccivora]|uniref:Uncharacterized protein n=1 Tax=Aphis craccivora TaxID=307492 RepID=A0A6G0Z228_APHCR|nr:Uncharacterized protein FWK35_00001778 [Aphis craccivora]